MAEPARRPPVDRYRPPDAAWYRGRPARGIDPERHLWILDEVDNGYIERYMELLDDVACDAHVASVLRTRKLAVAGSNYEFQAADSTPAAEAIAEAAREFVDRIPCFKQLCMDLLDAVYRGFAAVRPIWDSKDGNWWVIGHDAIESRMFRFDRNTPLVKTAEHDAGEPLPPGWLFHVQRDKAGPIVRGALGRSISLMWIYKRYAWIDKMGFIDRFGQPFIHATLPDGTRPDSPLWTAVEDAIQRMMAEHTAVTIPGVKFEALDVGNKGVNIRDVYIAIEKACDAEISKAVLGGTLTVEAGPGGLGHGREAQEHGDVRQDIREDDAGRLEDTLNEQLIKPWAFYHFGEQGLKLQPYIHFDVKAPEDQVQIATARKLEAEMYEILRAEGMDLSKRQLREDFDLEEPDDEDDTLKGSPEPAPPPAVPSPTGTPPGIKEQPGAAGTP